MKKAEFHPSSLNRGQYCHGSVGLSREKDAPTIAMKRGTEKHKAAAAILGNTAKKVLTADEKEFQQFLDKNKNEDWVRIILRNGLRYNIEKTIKIEYDNYNIVGTPDLWFYDEWADGMTSDGVCVYDWKFSEWEGNLSPLFEDWQLITYASMIYKVENAWPVHVYRVIPPLGICESMTFNKDALDLALKAVDELIEDILIAPNKFTLGHWCEKCFVSIHCEKFLAQANAVPDIKALVPFVGGQIEHDQRLHVARAMIPAKKIMKSIEEQLKASVDTIGPIVDPETDRVYSAKESDVSETKMVKTGRMIRRRYYRWRKM